MFTIFFLLMVIKVEAFFMVMARLAHADRDYRARMDELSLLYASHPLWGVCLAITTLFALLIVHIMFGKMTCNARGMALESARCTGAK